MVVIATWPLMRAVESRSGGRRWIAVGVMTLAILLILVLPLALAVGTIAEHSEDIAGWLSSAAEATLPAPPGWVEKIPLAGPRIAERLHAVGKNYFLDSTAIGTGEIGEQLGLDESRSISRQVSAAAKWLQHSGDLAGSGSLDTGRARHGTSGSKNPYYGRRPAEIPRSDGPVANATAVLRRCDTRRFYYLSSPDKG
jgi:hypothetical protein